MRRLLSLFVLLALSLPQARAAEGPVDVVIIGAGLAGLSTAWRLKKAGLSYRIVELTPHIGGRIRTASDPEYKVSAELGLEEFWEGNPTLEIMDALKVEKEKSASSFSSFHLDGKVYPFKQETNREFLEASFTPAELKKYRAWDTRMIALYEETKKRPLSPELKKLMKLSFADWVRKKSGLSRRMQEFVRIESEPEYAASWESISALEGILEWHIFSGEGTRSYHVVGGNQKLAAAIADDIGRGNIVLNTKATRIESRADGVVVTGVDQGSYETRSFRGKYAVSTVPLFRLLEMQFEPPLSPERKAAIQSQGWGAYFTAHVVVDAAANKLWGGDESGVLPILTDSPLGVVYGEKGAAGSEYLLMNLLVCGAHAERFNLRAATAMDSVREELTEQFEKKWPGVSRHIRKFEFYQYHPRAIASWPVGRSRLDEQSDLMRTPQGRVYFAGDFTESTHSDGAAISAVRSVRQILEREGGKAK